MLPYIPIAKARGFTATFGKKNIKSLTVEYHGQHFANIKAGCQALNVSYLQVRNQMYVHHILFEQAVNIVKRGNIWCGYEINIENVLYPSISEAARALKIDVKVVQARMKANWSPELALTTPVNHLAVTYKGVYYPSHKDAAKAYGVNYGTLLNRMHKMHLSFEEAMEGNYTNHQPVFSFLLTEFVFHLLYKMLLYIAKKKKGET